MQATRDLGGPQRAHWTGCPGQSRLNIVNAAEAANLAVVCHPDIASILLVQALEVARLLYERKHKSPQNAQEGL